MKATGGMYADRQGIAGRTLPEVEDLEFYGMLESPEKDAAEKQEGLFKPK